MTTPAPAHPLGAETEEARVWPTRGPDFNRWNNDAAAFCALIQANDGFWCVDFPLKYLSLNVDTRSGHFRLKDRDGNEISPDRVLKAIAKWREWYPPPAEELIR